MHAIHPANIMFLYIDWATLISVGRNGMRVLKIILMLVFSMPLLFFIVGSDYVISVFDSSDMHLVNECGLRIWYLGLINRKIVCCYPSFGGTLCFLAVCRHIPSI